MNKITHVAAAAVLLLWVLLFTAPQPDMSYSATCDCKAQVETAQLGGWRSLICWFIPELCNPPQPPPPPTPEPEPEPEPEPPAPNPGGFVFPTNTVAVDKFEGRVNPSIWTKLFVQGGAISPRDINSEINRFPRSFRYVDGPDGKCLQITTHQGDAPADGDREKQKWRCELSSQDRAWRGEPGEDWTYGVSLRVVSGYEIGRSDGYCYVTQFLRDKGSDSYHANPTYGAFLSRGTNYPFKLWFKEQTSAARNYTKVVPSLIGEWQNFEFRIKWRADSSGQCRIFRNGQLLHTFNGRNMRSSGTEYHWKIGDYFGYGSTPDRVVQFDNVWVCRGEPQFPKSLLQSAVEDAVTAPVEVIKEGLN